MKERSILTTASLLILLIVACSVFHSQKNTDKTRAEQHTTTYKDGLYTGTSRSHYTSEPYWGIIRFQVKNGSFTEIHFLIRDSDQHETFNENYEKHFKGNNLYIQQCMNDWKGAQQYPKKLSETQNPDKVDAITGATWSYNIFKASLKEALKDAKGETVRK